MGRNAPPAFEIFYGYAPPAFKIYLYDTELLGWFDEADKILVWPVCGPD